MPTINQLPSATTVAGADAIPLSQNGLTRSVTVATLLGGTQPLVTISQGNLLGRSSAGTGGPEALKLGAGLGLLGTAVAANGTDHTGFAQATVLQPTDELVINSGAMPKRVTAAAVRSLFSAGAGVTIDPSGLISATSGNGGSGSQGPAGPAGPAGQGFSFRGAFQANTSYGPYDVVVSGGQSYVATSSFVSGSTFDGAKWTLIAAQGAAGSPGAQGQAGAQGPAGPTNPATSSSLGAVKPGAGLAVSSDGTLSIGSVNLGTLSQGGAAVGQVLGWTGTGWGPTSGSAAGVASFNTRLGNVTLTAADVTAAIGSGSSARASLGLALIASSGSYSDLSGAPLIPTAATTAPAMNGTATAGTGGAFSRADHVHPSDTTRLAVANNLGDLANINAARTNLGLGSAATLNVGTTAGTVAAGNDSRLATALQASAIPAAAGQLLGGSGSAGLATAVSLGAGLSLTGGTLSATSGTTYTLPAATTTTLGGIKPDGSTVTSAADGTLSVNSLSTTSLADIGTLGGPALSDVDVLNRGGADYKVAMSSRVALFRKTPAGSRTVTLSLSSTVATLSAADHDKTVVVTGAISGTLTVDGTITDGFRCQVINHTGSALTYTGITGLQGAGSLSSNASCWVTLSNASVEATPTSNSSTSTPGGASGQLQYNNSGVFGGVTLGTGLTMSAGTLNASAGAPATTTTLGTIKSDGNTVAIGSDGTLSVPGVSISSLSDVAASGGPALSDIDVVNRGGVDYRTTLSARGALFRKTPAGSRTVTLSSGATTATLTSTDHDKTVVVAGSTAGTLAADSTIADGFRCQVINHTGSPLAYSGMTGLQGTTALSNNATCWVSLANSTLEASAPGAAAASAGVTTFNTRNGSVTLTLADVTAVTGTGSAVQANLGLGVAATLNVGTTAGTVAAGNDGRLVGALQVNAIPAATGQLLGGSGTAGAAASIALGSGLTLSGNTLSASSTYILPTATSSSLGGVKQGGGISIAPDGTLSVPAYITVGVSGTVSSLPGGAGAVIYRYVFVRPFSLSANLASPFAPQGQSGTLPTSNASFTLAKRVSSGGQTSFGTITMSTTGVLSAATTALTFQAGDELMVLAPNPTDATVADVSLTFTGTWG